jgi:dolichol kinase
LLHASTAGVLLLLLVSSTALRAGTVIVALLAFVFEAVRLIHPAARRAIERGLPVFRPREHTRISGAAWLAVGYAAAAWLPAPAPVAGILAGALADPAGSWIGGRWGGGQRKSGVGTLAVAVVAGAAALMAGITLPAAAACGVLGAALERWPGPLDDNLLVAPGVAGLAALLA